MFFLLLGARPSKTNTSRRACPDLSIYDSGFYTVQDGSDQPIGGTSAAAPTLAGMISSINGHLIDNKKTPLGFLNYFLYQNEKSFLDITKGGNNGFDATVGYDPASGLGKENSYFSIVAGKQLSLVSYLYSFKIFPNYNCRYIFTNYFHIIKKCCCKIKNDEAD